MSRPSSYEIAKIYQTYRQEIGHKYYRVALDDNGLMGFDKTSDKIIEMGGVNPEEFMKAQFKYFRPYPYPNQLYSNKATQNYVKYLREKSKGINGKELFETYESSLHQMVNNFVNKSVVELILTKDFPASFVLYTLWRLKVLNDNYLFLPPLMKKAYWELKANVQLSKYYKTKEFDFNSICKQYKHLVSDFSFGNLE